MKLSKKERVVEIKCGWCRKDFSFYPFKGEIAYKVNICPHCGRTLNSSNKKPTGDIVGRKHFHSDFKKGDIA